MEFLSTSAISSAFTATLRIAQTVYELKAVGENVRDLLDSTKYIEESLQAVRIIRRQKSKLFSTTEKEWIDNRLSNAENSVMLVAKLIEPARVDMQKRNSKTNNISLYTRAAFVLRDSPKLDTYLTRLGIATSGLDAAMVTLCNREMHGDPQSGGSVRRGARRVPSTSSFEKPPATEELSDFINRRRNRDAKRTELQPSQSDSDFKGPLSKQPSFAHSLRSEKSFDSMAPTEVNSIAPTTYQGRLASESLSSFQETDPLSWQYLDRQIDKTPACTPVLIVDDTLVEGSEAIQEKLSQTSHAEQQIEAWRRQTVEAINESHPIAELDSEDVGNAGNNISHSHKRASWTERTARADFFKSGVIQSPTSPPLPEAQLAHYPMPGTDSAQSGSHPLPYPLPPQPQRYVPPYVSSESSSSPSRSPNSSPVVNYRLQKHSFPGPSTQGPIRQNRPHSVSYPQPFLSPDQIPSPPQRVPLRTGPSSGNTSPLSQTSSTHSNPYFPYGDAQAPLTVTKRQAVSPHAYQSSQPPSAPTFTHELFSPLAHFNTNPGSHPMSSDPQGPVAGQSYPFPPPPPPRRMTSMSAHSLTSIDSRVSSTSAERADVDADQLGFDGSNYNNNQAGKAKSRKQAWTEHQVSRQFE